MLRLTPTDINVALRKIALLLKPDKEIDHQGDRMVVKTLSTFRDYLMEFEVGVEFEEDLRIVDGRKCQVISLRLKGERKDKQVPPDNVDQNKGSSPGCQSQGNDHHSRPWGPRTPGSGAEGSALPPFLPSSSLLPSYQPKDRRAGHPRPMSKHLSFPVL